MLHTLLTMLAVAASPEASQPAFVRCRSHVDVLSWEDLGVAPVNVPGADIGPLPVAEHAPGTVWTVGSQPSPEAPRYVAIDRNLPVDEVIALVGPLPGLFEVVEATRLPMEWPAAPGSQGGDVVQGWEAALVGCPAATALLATDGTCPEPSLSHAWRTVAADPTCGVDLDTASSMWRPHIDVSRGTPLAVRPLVRATGSEWLPAGTPWADVDTARGWPELQPPVPAGAVRFHHSEVVLKRRVAPVLPAPIPGGESYRCMATLYIERTGRVHLIRVDGCPDTFRAVIATAVEQWEYFPPRKDGKKVEALVQEGFTFR
ncbi:MAG: hypothetical protein H6735_19080 [Alphaproteobacteria bacterium]|nr:hypothetical protein [Alphaproteobacteria bacterium]